MNINFSPANLVAVNVVTGQTYTFVLADADKLVSFSSATAVVATVPPNSSVAWSLGTIIEVGQYGAGSVSIAAGAGVTIRSLGNSLILGGQYARAALQKIGTNEWWLMGALA